MDPIAFQILFNGLVERLADCPSVKDEIKCEYTHNALEITVCGERWYYCTPYINERYEVAVSLNCKDAEILACASINTAKIIKRIKGE